VNKPINKAAALEYLRKGWVLEICQGIRFHTWAWVRSKPKSSECVHVHMNSAYALRDSGLMVEDVTDEWNPVWRLKNP
jgi:hypothetical protein